MAIGGNRQVVCPPFFGTRLFSIIFFLMVIGLSVPAGEADEFTRAAEAARESLVLVRARIPGQGPGKDAQWVSNTGFVVSERGHILTSLYAVSGATRIHVRALSGQEKEANLLSMHQPSGLALLAAECDRPPLELVSAPMKPGQWALMASMRGLALEQSTALSFQPVVISSVHGNLRCNGRSLSDMITFNASCNGGAATASILTAEGKVGAVLFNTVRSRSGLSCCYGLPARKLRPIISDLIQGKSTRSGWLGLAVLYDPEEKGLEVKGVLDGSPAHESGIYPGDLLLAIDGKPITSAKVFSRFVLNVEPGRKVRIQLVRGEVRKTLTVTVGSRPVIISRGQSLKSNCGTESRAFRSAQGDRATMQYLRRSNRELRDILKGVKRDLRSMKKCLEEQEERPGNPGD